MDSLPPDDRSVVAPYLGPTDANLLEFTLPAEEKPKQSKPTTTAAV